MNIACLNRSLSLRRFLQTPARLMRFSVNWLSLAVLVLALSPAALRADAPSFVNEVVPLLTRYGCNQGSCHGKGSGQNGLRLSLRGYAPDWDHTWITREFTARRINPAVPEQ